MNRTIHRTKRAPVRAKRAGVNPRTERKGFHAGRYVILLAILGAGGWFAGMPALDRVTSLPVFTVVHVAVEGVVHLDRSRIIETAGIVPGVNIFRVDLKRASDRLMKAFAAEDFTLYRRLPGTIVIKVRERTPVALINEGKLIGIDASGVLLPHIGADMAESLPIITGIGADPKSLAEPSAKARILAGLKLLDEITRQSPGVEKRISEINVSSLSGMGINLIDTGLEVIIGENGWSKKIPNLERVIGQVTGRMDSVKIVDMRFDDRVIVKKSYPAARGGEPAWAQGTTAR
jgi:cell division protein FtsQ